MAVPGKNTLLIGQEQAVRTQITTNGQQPIGFCITGLRENKFVR